ncbi:hypothetical protein [Flavobacterium sp.]|jgi:hypothetical protein|uniref:hypothetical protein n=1 Tax=Flavobacterium sp. TaxID=239 RepID=UPI0037BEF836
MRKLFFALVTTLLINTLSYGQDFEKFITERYKAKVEMINKSDFNIIYSDGKVLIAKKQSDGSYKVTGSKINNNSFVISQNEGKFDESNPASNFRINATMANPCGQHPAGETFNQCFKREWADFCDGFVGCVAQATNPVGVALVIAAHCVAC